MYTLEELATHLHATLLGDGRIYIRNARPFEKAGPGDITLAAETKYHQRLAETNADAVIVGLDVQHSPKPALRVKDPKLSFTRLLHLFNPMSFTVHGIAPEAKIGTNCRIAPEVCIHPLAYVGDNVEIGNQVTIHPGAVVGDGCRIGNGTTIHPNVTLYPGIIVGARVILHSGCVIGADGFGYVLDGERQLKIPHTGTVIIEDDVEIGANTTIDRGTFNATVIHRGVKIDNLVQIGHNCDIGENTVICGCVGISGSVTIGKNCILAGNVGVADHVTLGDQVTVLARSGVSKDFPDKAKIWGAPARNHREELKFQALLRKLPELFDDMEKLKDKLDK